MLELAEGYYCVGGLCRQVVLMGICALERFSLLNGSRDEFLSLILLID